MPVRFSAPAAPRWSRGCDVSVKWCGGAASCASWVRGRDCPRPRIPRRRCIETVAVLPVPLTAMWPASRPTTPPRDWSCISRQPRTTPSPSAATFTACALLAFFTGAKAVLVGRTDAPDSETLTPETGCARRHGRPGVCRSSPTSSAGTCRHTCL